MEKNTKKYSRLGIDIGRVILSPVKGGKSDTSFLRGDHQRAMETPPSPNAFGCITELTKQFSGQVWLVSKAGLNTQAKTRKWLSHQDFFEKTGIPNKNLRFCLRRSQKAHHCTELEITHFIDDRLDVLQHLRDYVPYLYLFGEQPYGQIAPEWVMPVLDWPEAERAVKRDFEL